MNPNVERSQGEGKRLEAIGMTGPLLFGQDLVDLHTSCQRGGGGTVICSVCWVLWCNYYHHTANFKLLILCHWTRNLDHTLVIDCHELVQTSASMPLPGPNRSLTSFCLPVLVMPWRTRPSLRRKPGVQREQAGSQRPTSPSAPSDIICYHF